MTTIAQQLDRLADEIYPEGRQFIDTDTATFRVRKEWAEKLRAIRAAVGGEAVAWRRVHVWPDGKRRGPHGPWRDIAERVDEQHGDSIEYAYASPPATVGVGALRELISEMQALTDRNTGLGMPVFSCAYVIDKLAALIGEKA